jgi:hypothetical protein
MLENILFYFIFAETARMFMKSKMKWKWEKISVVDIFVAFIKL